MFFNKIPKYQIITLTIISVIGSIYTWKPELEKVAENQKEELNKNTLNDI